MATTGTRQRKEKDTHYRLVIIGGGLMGSAIAYFLSADKAFSGSILVVEKDPSYGRCSSSLSAGGIRTQFSTPENVLISKFGAEFLKNARHYLSIEGEEIDLSFKERGYLFLATERGWSTLQANAALQNSLGARIDLLAPSQLRRLFPDLRVTDLAGGALGRENEGWLDAYSLLMAFRRKALRCSVQYRNAGVTGLTQAHQRITGLYINGSEYITCDAVVNAAGPAAAHIARMAGVELPVQSRKRQVFVVACPKAVRLPMVIDPSGVYIREEGHAYLCGTSPPPDRDPESFDFSVEEELFYDTIWPLLAHRIPAFENLRLESSWAGHYAYNTLDQNAVLGAHPRIGNFYFCNGFSGHGLQQSPAVGRALAELITYGKYQSLDLTQFGFDRFAENRLIVEKNVV